MKKLVALYPDTATPDLSSLMAVAVEFRLDNIPNEAPAKPLVKRHHSGPGRTAQDDLMKHFTPQGVFTLEQGIRWLTSEGYAKTTFYTAAARAIKAGKLRRLGNQKYQFVGPA